MAGSVNAPIVYSDKAVAVQPSDWNAAWTYANNTFDQTMGIIVETTEVTATAAETTIYEVVIPANYLKVGHLLKGHVCGIATNANASEDITINMYIGNNLIQTFTPTTGKLTNNLWDADAELIIRAIGTSGNLSESLAISIGLYDDHHHDDTQAINTETANNFKVTVTWASDSASNSIKVFQGYLEFKY